MTQPLEIVLADDDPEEVGIFTDALKEIKINHSFRSAHNAERLFGILQEKIPHILFLDIGMPITDGKHCIMEIRKESLYDRMPIIVYSNYSMNTIIDECYERGATHYFHKPTRYSSFCADLQTVFSTDWAGQWVRPDKLKFVVGT